MAVSSTRAITHGYTGDVTLHEVASAAANASSPGTTEAKALANGANTITKPTGAVGVTLTPPSGNTVTLTLKGVSGDTGVGLHLTDPTSIGLAAGVTTFVITTNSTVTVRLTWT